MRRFFRSAMVIARRDFTATVLSKAFILFLIGPLLPLLIGGTFAGLGAKAASEAARPVIAVISSASDYAALDRVRTRTVEALGGGIPELRHFAPAANAASQQKALLESRDPPVLAVLSLNAANATLTGGVEKEGSAARSLQLLLDQAHARPMGPVPTLQVVETGRSSGKLAAGRSETAHAGQFLLFFLTMLLATMLLSQVIEEKSNKIIEVIAAAIPIDAMFVGKLFAMLAASLVGLVVWIGVGAALIASISSNGLQALPQPAVGWPAFLLLAIVYFAMNYLTLGALFLAIGAQASTPREVQTLSLPVTILQVLVFAFAMTAVGKPDSGMALSAALFPLSSPLVMIARAAELPELWPHLLALAWQFLWVGLILRMGSRFFRSRVLKSGPAGKKRRRRPAAA